MQIAVVGAGIAGLSAAWLLSTHHEITLFECETRPGGHSNTIEVPTVLGQVPVDTGFIVYNTATYPNLVALFAYLQVPTVRSDMSFAVSLGQGDYEYSARGVGLFAQASNILSLRHWQMLLELRRFLREMRALAAGGSTTAPSLGAILTEHGYAPAFVSGYVLPMAAAIWSCPFETMLRFPALSFARFFANHGLLQVRKRPEWRTVVGGSRTYVDLMLASFRGTIALGRRVKRLHRHANGVTVTDGDDRTHHFDACVIATHADEALALLADPAQRERELLSAFRYQRNRAVLHTDAALMPRRRRVWSSWNYVSTDLSNDAITQRRPPSVTYWMNRLQPLGIGHNVFVTLNPSRPIQASAEIAAFDYDHPVFDLPALAAQAHLWSLQGQRRTWYCGSYFGYGFHEDALQSGLAAAEHIGSVRRPWTVADESGRIVIGSTAAEPLGEAAE